MTHETIPNTTNDFINTLIHVSGDFALRDTVDNARQVLDFLTITECETQDYDIAEDARRLISRMAIDALDYVMYQLNEKKL